MTRALLKSTANFDNFGQLRSQPWLRRTTWTRALVTSGALALGKVVSPPRMGVERYMSTVATLLPPFFVPCVSKNQS